MDDNKQKETPGAMSFRRELRWLQNTGKGKGLVTYVLTVASGFMVFSIITLQQKWHFDLDLGYEREV